MDTLKAVKVLHDLSKTTDQATNFIASQAERLVKSSGHEKTSKEIAPNGRSNDNDSDDEDNINDSTPKQEFLITKFARKCWNGFIGLFPKSPRARRFMNNVKNAFTLVHHVTAHYKLPELTEAEAAKLIKINNLIDNVTRYDFQNYNFYADIHKIVFRNECGTSKYALEFQLGGTNFAFTLKSRSTGRMVNRIHRFGKPGQSAMTEYRLISEGEAATFREFEQLNWRGSHYNLTKEFLWVYLWERIAPMSEVCVATGSINLFVLSVGDMSQSVTLVNAAGVVWGTVNISISFSPQYVFFVELSNMELEYELKNGKEIIPNFSCELENIEELTRSNLEKAFTIRNMSIVTNERHETKLIDSYIAASNGQIKRPDDSDTGSDTTQRFSDSESPTPIGVDLDSDLSFDSDDEDAFSTVTKPGPRELEIKKAFESATARQKNSKTSAEVLADPELPALVRKAPCAPEGVFVVVGSIRDVVQSNYLLKVNHSTRIFHSEVVASMPLNIGRFLQQSSRKSFSTSLLCSHKSFQMARVRGYIQIHKSLGLAQPDIFSDSGSKPLSYITLNLLNVANEHGKIASYYCEWSLVNTQNNVILYHGDNRGEMTQTVNLDIITDKLLENYPVQLQKLRSRRMLSRKRRNVKKYFTFINKLLRSISQDNQLSEILDHYKLIFELQQLEPTYKEFSDIEPLVRRTVAWTVLSVASIFDKTSGPGMNSTNVKLKLFQPGSCSAVSAYSIHLQICGYNLQHIGHHESPDGSFILDQKFLDDIKSDSRKILHLIPESEVLGTTLHGYPMPLHRFICNSQMMNSLYFIDFLNLKTPFSIVESVSAIQLQPFANDYIQSPISTIQNGIGDEKSICFLVGSLLNCADVPFFIICGTARDSPMPRWGIVTRCSDREDCLFWYFPSAKQIFYTVRGEFPDYRQEFLRIPISYRNNINYITFAEVVITNSAVFIPKLFVTNSNFHEFGIRLLTDPDSCDSLLRAQIDVGVNEVLFNIYCSSVLLNAAIKRNRCNDVTVKATHARKLHGMIVPYCIQQLQITHSEIGTKFVSYLIKLCEKQKHSAANAVIDVVLNKKQIKGAELQRSNSDRLTPTNVEICNVSYMLTNSFDVEKLKERIVVELVQSNAISFTLGTGIWSNNFGIVIAIVLMTRSRISYYALVLQNASLYWMMMARKLKKQHENKLTTTAPTRKNQVNVQSIFDTQLVRKLISVDNTNSSSSVVLSDDDLLASDNDTEIEDKIIDELAAIDDKLNHSVSLSPSQVEKINKFSILRNFLNKDN